MFLKNDPHDNLNLRDLIDLTMVTLSTGSEPETGSSEV